MSGNINENKEISIKQLQSKLVNIEFNTLSNQTGVNSIFHAYDVNKEEDLNEIKRLKKDELQSLVNDIKSFDGKGGKKDDIIDMNEADNFVKDFNMKHPESRITTSDLFGFVQRVYERHDYYERNDIGAFAERITVGKPLSKKEITLHVVNPKTKKYETVKMSIKLYATNNQAVPHQYVWHIEEGKDLTTSIANEYGYHGENAFLAFLQNSLGKPNPDTYEVNFKPKFISKKLDNVDSEYTTTTTTSKTISDNGKAKVNQTASVESMELIVPHDFDIDPEVIQAKYNDPETQKLMKEFCEYLEVAINDADTNLKEYLKSYGWTEHTADIISLIWNNDFIGGTNTQWDMKEMIEKARELLQKMKNADNSINGVTLHKDFGSYFKQLTGDTEFDPAKTKEFLDYRNEYLQKQSVIATHEFVKEFTSTVEQFVKVSKDRKTGSKSNEEQYQKMNEKLYLMFNNFIGIERKDWDKMLADFDKKGVDSSEYIQAIANNIIEAIEAEAKKVLGVDNLDNIDDIKDQIQEKYEKLSEKALGEDGNLVERVDSYNTSQLIGGIAVYAIANMILYATGNVLLTSVGTKFVGALPKLFTAAKSAAPKTVEMLSKSTQMLSNLTKKIPKADKIISTMKANAVSGAASGGSYSGSYLIMETTNRLSNDIPNDIDLWSDDAKKDLMVTAGAEFFAGYMFDGALKAKLFSKGEKFGLNIERTAYNTGTKALNPIKTGELFLKKTGKIFTKDFLAKYCAARGIAGGVGFFKDGLKELFKEYYKSKYNLSDIATSAVVGGISNAFFIRFKTSSFAKVDHKIIGKFIEKSPKGTVKQEEKEFASSDSTLNEATWTNDEDMYMENLFEDIKSNVIDDLNKNAKINSTSLEEINNFIRNNPKAFNEMIIDYYVLNYIESNE